MRLLFLISSIEKRDPNNLIIATTTTPTLETTMKSLEFLEKSEQNDDDKNENKIVKCMIKNNHCKLN